MAVSLTVYEVFRVKVYRDLENWLGVVQRYRWIDHKRLSIGPPFKFSSIWYRFFSYLTLNDIMTLKFGLEVTQDHSNRYHSKAWVGFPIRLP